MALANGDMLRIAASRNGLVNISVPAFRCGVCFLCRGIRTRYLLARCSVTLNSVSRGSIKSQPKQLSALSRNFVANLPSRKRHAQARQFDVLVGCLGLGR